MLFEACVKTRNGSVKMVAVEGRSRKEAISTAKNYSFASKNEENPIVYIRKIGEDEYLSIQDGSLYEDSYYFETA